MARITSPLFGLKARGQIGKALVFSDWKGVSYARTRVTPANPRTEAQTKTRSVFSWLNLSYRDLPGGVTEVWQAAAKGRPLTDRNLYLRNNVPILRDATDISGLVVSPGTQSLPPLAGVNATGGSSPGEIDVTVTTPTPPSGYNLTGVRYVAIRQQDPHDPYQGPIGYLEVTSSPYGGTISGLEPGETYLIAAFPVYGTPQGQIAYGPSLNTTATASA